MVKPLKCGHPSNQTTFSGVPKVVGLEGVHFSVDPCHSDSTFFSFWVCMSSYCAESCMLRVEGGQWQIQNFEKGVSDSATPTLATPSFSN